MTYERPPPYIYMNMYVPFYRTTLDDTRQIRRTDSTQQYRESSEQRDNNT